MAKLYVPAALLAIFSLNQATAQTPAQVIFYNNGATVYTAPNAVVQVNGGLTNDGVNAVIDHNGTIHIANSSTDGSVFLINSSAMQGDGLYRVEQDWQNDATFIAGNSEVELYGNAEQFITSANGTVTTFNDLTLTGTGAGLNKRKTLLNVDAGTGANGILTLNNRELATDVNTFFVANPATNAITNVVTPGAEGYVSSDGLAGGRLSRVMTASQTYVYPTGSATGTYRYRPVDMTPDAASTFGVRLANYDATLSTYNTALTPATACLLNNLFFHQIDRMIGTANATVNIHYDSGVDGNWDGMAQWGTPTAATWNDVNAQTFNIAGPNSNVQKTTHTDFNDNPFCLSRVAPPAPGIAGTDSICDFGSAIISVNPSNPGSVYNWTVTNGSIVSGQGTDEITVIFGAGGGSASVTETGAGGCNSIAATHTVLTFPSPLAGFDTIAGGQFGNLITFNDTSSNATGWNWDFGDGGFSTSQSPTHNFNAGTYSVMLIASSGSGCADTVYTTVIIPENYIVPNVFTPNGDGVNDWFFIPNTGIDGFTMKVFNRWGTQIWESTSANVRWDGRTTAGIEVPAGTYYYMLEGTTSPSATAVAPRTGFVTLVR